MTKHEGGCLCGSVRFAALNDPRRVVICHCRFCQKATGGAYMIEPIFGIDDLTVLSGMPRVFDLVSSGSGKVVHVHFCAECGTKLWLSFEHFDDVVGVYAGTFDDPCWFAIEPETSRHIFLNAARPDSLIPAGTPTYEAHAIGNDGTPQKATVYDTCLRIADR